MQWGKPKVMLYEIIEEENDGRRLVLSLEEFLRYREEYGLPSKLTTWRVSEKLAPQLKQLLLGEYHPGPEETTLHELDGGRHLGWWLLTPEELDEWEKENGGEEGWMPNVSLRSVWRVPKDALEIARWVLNEIICMDWYPREWSDEQEWSAERARLCELLKACGAHPR